MSHEPASADVAPAKMTAPPAAVAAARNAALRIAFGAVIGFLLAGAFQITLFFLPALLAAQLLSLMPRPPGLAQGAGLVFLMGVLAWITLLIAGVFAGQPGRLSHDDRPAALLRLPPRQCRQGDAGDAASHTGVDAPAGRCAVRHRGGRHRGGPGRGDGHRAPGRLDRLRALLRRSRPSPPRLAQAGLPRRAPPSSTRCCLSPFSWSFSIDGRMTFVSVIVIVNIIRQREHGAASDGPGPALRQYPGRSSWHRSPNVFVSIQTSPVFFLLVVLLVGLTLAGRGVVAGPKGPIQAPPSSASSSCSASALLRSRANQPEPSSIA